MKAVQVERFGVENLRVAEVADPKPGRGEVLVATEAATVNPADATVVTGAAAPRLPWGAAPPYTPGWDLVGRIVEVGPGIDAVIVGTRVIGFSLWFESVRGTQASLVALPVGNVVPAPDSPLASDLTTVGLNGLTVWRGLADLKLAEGETLVVTGAAGSVGGFAVGLAASRGFTVIGVVRGDDKQATLDLGATAAVSAEVDQLGVAVREIVPGGADALLDTASIAGPALAGVRDGGKYVTVTELPSPERGIDVFRSGGRMDAPALATLVEMASTGRLHTPVAKTFALGDARARLRGVRQPDRARSHRAHLPGALTFGRRRMQYRNLGRTGIKVSPYGLGALMLATQVGNPDPEDSIRIIHKALDAGINLVDTADSYGDSEEVVGRALEGRRDNVVLATKVSRPMGTDPNQQGASRRWIMTAVENSLRRLQTDHIDVYQIQRPDPDTDIEETLSALTDLVRSGTIRAFGSSMMPASNLVEAHWVAERRGLERFRTEQPPYSILNRSIEREVLPVAQQYGMGILVWGPLGQGMLTGRVRRGQDSDVTRARFFAAFSDERRLDAVEQLLSLAEEAGLSMPHLAMAFAVSHPGVTSALLGARTMEQLDDLLAGVDVVLSDDVLDRIDEIVPPGTDIGTLDQAYVPPAIQKTELRRRPLSERSAT